MEEIRLVFSWILPSPEPHHALPFPPQSDIMTGGEIVNLFFHNISMQTRKFNQRIATDTRIGRQPFQVGIDEWFNHQVLKGPSQIHHLQWNVKVCCNFPYPPNPLLYHQRGRGKHKMKTIDLPPGRLQQSSGH